MFSYSWIAAANLMTTTWHPLCHLLLQYDEISNCLSFIYLGIVFSVPLERSNEKNYSSYIHITDSLHHFRFQKTTFTKLWQQEIWCSGQSSFEATGIDFLFRFWGGAHQREMSAKCCTKSAISIMNGVLEKAYLMIFLITSCEWLKQVSFALSSPHAQPLETTSVRVCSAIFNISIIIQSFMSK